VGWCGEVGDCGGLGPGIRAVSTTIVVSGERERVVSYAGSWLLKAGLLESTAVVPGFGVKMGKLPCCGVNNVLE
jgi:hypothetical protein